MDYSELILIAVTGIIGFIGGYLSHKQKLKIDRISAKRERIVKNVSKAEDYIQLMIEESFLEHDQRRVEELLDTIEINLDIVRKGLGETETEIKKTEEELKNKKGENLDKLENIKKRLLSTIKKYQSLLEAQILKREEIVKELEERRLRNDQIKKRLIVDDIGSTFLTIDPSGKIAGYLKELQSIQSDVSIDFYSNARAIELRSKINNFFTEIISKVE